MTKGGSHLSPGPLTSPPPCNQWLLGGMGWTSPHLRRTRERDQKQERGDRAEIEPSGKDLRVRRSRRKTTRRSSRSEQFKEKEEEEEEKKGKEKKGNKKRRLVNGTIISSDGSSSPPSGDSEEEDSSSEAGFEAPLKRRSKESPGAVLRLLVVQRAQEV